MYFKMLLKRNYDQIITKENYFSFNMFAKTFWVWTMDMVKLVISIERIESNA